MLGNVAGGCHVSMAKQMPRPETQPTNEQESTSNRGSDPSIGAILPVGYLVGLWLGPGECFLMLNLTSIVFFLVIIRYKMEKHPHKFSIISD